MAKYYPHIDFRDLMTLYGTFYNISNITQKLYLHLYKSNMTKIAEIEDNLRWLLRSYKLYSVVQFHRDGKMHDLQKLNCTFAEI